MAKIIELAALLPEDIVIVAGDGQRFTLPGDPPLETILRIASLFERAQEDPEATGLDILQAMDDVMIELLQMRDPKITRSPFGVMGVQHVVAQLLAAYNFGEEELPPTKTRTASSARPRKSRRSSGSRSS